MGSDTMWIGGGNLDEQARSDARIVARFAEAQAHLDSVVLPAYHAQRAESERKREADRAESERKREAVVTLVRAYVLAHVPEYARAASEGRDVTAIGLRAASEQIEAALRAAIDTVSACDSRLRKVPTTYAYGVRDRVAARVAATMDALPAELRALAPEHSIEIVSADLCDLRRCIDSRTCIEVMVNMIGTEPDPCVYALAEAVVVAHVHEAPSVPDEENDE